jgi:hypothetical protein
VASYIYGQVCSEVFNSRKFDPFLINSPDFNTMVQVGSQNKREKLLKNLHAYLASSQIWLNLPVDYSQFWATSQN